jgi:hypothetical protein
VDTVTSKAVESGIYSVPGSLRIAMDTRNLVVRPGRRVLLGSVQSEEVQVGQLSVFEKVVNLQSQCGLPCGRNDTNGDAILLRLLDCWNVDCHSVKQAGKIGWDWKARLYDDFNNCNMRDGRN